MTIRFISLGFFLSLAEATGSWWIWARSPSDSVRVWYSDFWAFEASRLHFWVLAFASVMLLTIAAWYCFRRWSDNHNKAQGSTVWWLPSMVIAVGLEVSVSRLYWMSSKSFCIRSLYQSIWYWHRVPQPSDLGWPSFLGYMFAHFFPWAIMMLLCQVAWHLWHRRKKP